MLIFFRTYFPQFMPLSLDEPKLGFDYPLMEQKASSSTEVNFQVLCLYAKVFARSGFPFADYLARMSNPPPFQTTRTNIQALKVMEALNNLEDITELGNHLLDLPVEPRLGKMILYAVTLKCLDPVLTIVACLSHRYAVTSPTFLCLLGLIFCLSFTQWGQQRPASSPPIFYDLC